MFFGRCTNVKVVEMINVTSCAGKYCIIYSCTTLPMTDFRELFSCSQYGDLTITTILQHGSTAVKLRQLYPAHDVTKMAAQKTLFKLFARL